MNDPNLPNPSDWLDEAITHYVNRPLIHEDRWDDLKAAILSKLQTISQTAYKQALYDSGYGALRKVESVEKRLEGFKQLGASGSEA